ATASQVLRARTSGSQRMTSEVISERHLPEGYSVLEDVAGQDAYTLRCVPQIIGACIDTMAWHRTIVETELCSATDNPIFPGDPDRPALHGGNFMGQHVGLASDALSNAILVLAGLMERQVARLTDERLNNGLPAFLAGGTSGLNSGFMGAQVTATALLAEMRSNAGAVSVQSISTNAANQDVVSMGTIAARKCADHLRETNRIQAILALCIAQGVDFIGTAEPWAPATLALHSSIRKHAPKLERDRALAAEIELVSEQICSEDPPEVGRA
ncbi:MAG: aromatic amino acid ammonia-lyase, partial [Pseudomonadota bacterium]